MTKPARRLSGLSVSARWTIGVFVVIVALVVAIWPRGSAEFDPGTSTAPLPGAAAPAEAGDNVSPQELTRARQAAALEPCPVPDLADPADSPMAGVSLSCLADGQLIEVANATEDLPLVLNVWAYWCGPCRTELPIIAEFAATSRGQVQVLTVHGQDGAQNLTRALTMLADIGVTLPTVVDTDAQLARVLGIPRVYPCTVLIRADGTVAAVMPQIFDTRDELAAAVEEHLDVAA
ncbi:thiol-disulfide isomerase/thioredoxin [Williamsia limnetica]|uniref:Thiol-disulfide isomerase/thioredoxin n=1 Tax=Williamsia limnetica TaxID=882452 RepID=A0A318RD62_WILLI|nr:TlpA disulfide reductase family protein [Williamsia limnetica]PYE11795.1 thiol-disulfide isomerase/thioredoxin [Williamsia limnetica]